VDVADEAACSVAWETMYQTTMYAAYRTMGEAGEGVEREERVED